MFDFIGKGLRAIIFPFFMNKVEDMYHPKKYEKTGTEVDNWIEEVDKKGFHVVENFFSKEELEGLKLETNKIDEAIDNGSFPQNTNSYFKKNVSSTRVFHVEEVSKKINEIYAKNKLFTLLIDTYYGVKDNYIWSMYQKTVFNPTVDQSMLYGGGWHIDTFRRSLKIFIYLDDVSIEQGPFTYLPSSNKLDKLKLKYLKKSFIEGNNNYERYLTKRDFMDLKVYEDALPLTAKAGTVIFAETRGWHTAGLLSGGERKVLVNYYNKTNIKPLKLFGKYLTYEV